MKRFARTIGALIIGVLFGAILAVFDVIRGEPLFGATGVLWSGFVVLCYVIAAGLVLDFIALLRRRK